MVKLLIAFCIFATLSVISVDALQCWFCVRRAEEFGLKLKESCSSQTCPSGTQCYIEINKSPFSGGLQSLRGCSPHADCHRSRGVHCRVCKRDFCNAELEKFYVA